MDQAVVYSSPFVPAEWIAAHGLRPCRLGPVPEHRPTGPAVAAMGVCSYTAMLLSDARQCEASGIILTTTCDQMRRAAERIAASFGKPTFLMHVPATWQTATARTVYRDELIRLSTWLQSIGGHQPTDLLQIMRTYEASRQELRQRPESPTDRIRLAIVGGPLEYPDLCLLDIIEQAGGRVVLDATETGQRTLPGPFDWREANEDPLGELVVAYFGSIPDAFRRPNTHLYDYLQAEITQRQIQGVLLVRRVWCDLWHAELARMKETLSVPVIEVDLEGADAGQWERTRTRVESLLEVLQ